jgi:hypothetical protein
MAEHVKKLELERKIKVDCIVSNLERDTRIRTFKAHFIRERTGGIGS